MLQAVLNKSWKYHHIEQAVVWPLTSHFESHPNETTKTFGTLLKKQSRTPKRRSSMTPYTGTCQ